MKRTAPVFALLLTVTGANVLAARNGDDVGAGQCFYADRFAPLLEQRVVFADCDTARIERDGEDAVFRFEHSSRDRGIDFRARLEGGNWHITSVRSPAVGWHQASGLCTIYRDKSVITTLTCVTMHGAITYAANFEVGREQSLN